MRQFEAAGQAHKEPHGFKNRPMLDGNDGLIVAGFKNVHHLMISREQIFVALAHMPAHDAVDIGPPRSPHQSHPTKLIDSSPVYIVKDAAELCGRQRKLLLLLMISILHYLKDPKLYGNYGIFLFLGNAGSIYHRP